WRTALRRRFRTGRAGRRRLRPLPRPRAWRARIGRGARCRRALHGRRLGAQLPPARPRLRRAAPGCRPRRRRARSRRLPQGRGGARRSGRRAHTLSDEQCRSSRLTSPRPRKPWADPALRLTAVIQRERGRLAAASICISNKGRQYASAMTRTASRRDTFLSFQPPAIGDEEIEAVTETLRSGWLTTGPRTAELERRFAEYVGAKHALAVTSGTAALHMALVALGVGPGDEVITTPITWPATANVIVHTGATPVFADVRESDLNIDPEDAARLVGPR